MTEQIANFASTTLNGAITNSATSLTVTSATGFPISGNFRLVIQDAENDETNREIVLVTGVSGAVFTVTRAQESTSGVAHGNGSFVGHVLTAAGLSQFASELSFGAVLEYKGTNSIGASLETLPDRGQKFKQFTLSHDSIVISIDAYWAQSSAGVTGPNVAIFADNSGSVGDAIAYQHSGLPMIAIGQDSPGWLCRPMSVFLPAGTYWAAVQAIEDASVDGQLYYDTGGSDRQYTASGDWLHEPNGSDTDSTRNYSIRVHVMRISDVQQNTVSGVSLTKSSTQAITQSTSTAVTFDGEDFDTDDYHDNSTNPSRITVPLTGWYLVGGSAEMSGMADQTWSILRLRVDGTTVLDGRSRVSYSGTNGASNTYSKLVYLTAGSYVEMMIEHNDTAADVRESVNGTSFWCYRIVTSRSSLSPSSGIADDNGNAPYTVSGSTSHDLDATNLTIDLTVQEGSRIQWGWSIPSASVSNTSDNFRMQLGINGTGQGTVFHTGSSAAGGYGETRMWPNASGMTDPMSAGTYTLTIMVSHSNNTATINGAVRFWAVEIPA